MADRRVLISSTLEQNLHENTTDNDNDNHTSEVNSQAKNLTVNEKGKFKWHGSFENLKTLMNKITEKETKWSSSGYCKMLDLDEVVVRWYSNNNSLTINGNMSENMKSQLRILAALTKADSETTNNIDTDTNETGQDDSGVCITNCDESLTNINGNDKFEVLLDTLQKLEKRLVQKINNLESEIHETKIELYNEKMIRGENEAMNKSSVNDQSSAVNKLLTKDNDRLKKENDSLKEQINNYKCIMSDLNLKVKDLENEKNSLVTVIKIIQNDQEQQQASWNVVNNRKKTTEGRNTPAHNPVGTKNVKAKESVQQKNQYTALSISVVDDSESDSNNVSDNRSDDITATQVPKQDQRHERNRHSKKDSQKVKEANIPKNTKHNRPTVAILGDSMLKHLNPRKIQHGLDHKVTIKTFPGAGVDEMIHYVRPTLKKKPNHVVLHVGTNDLQTKSPDTLITAISRLGETITQEGNGTELTLSEVITRNDNANLADKVNVFNKKLDELCTEHNWGLIKHDNITRVHLNNYGLHLNQRGTSTLAGNVKQFLKNQVFD